MLKSARAAPRDMAMLVTPAASPDSLELAVSTLQQQVVGILRGEVRHFRHVALGDEQINEAVIVHVFKLRVPGRAGAQVAARVGAMRGDTLGKGHVLEGGFRRLAVLAAHWPGFAVCCRPCWSGNIPGSRRSRGHSRQCPCPRCARASSLPSRCRAQALGPHQHARAAPGRPRNIRGRWKRARRACRTCSSR